jgi:hypothetical protein
MARLILQDGIWKVVSDLGDRDVIKSTSELVTDLGGGLARRGDISVVADNIAGTVLIVTGSAAMAAGIYHLTSSTVDTTGTT